MADNIHQFPRVAGTKDVIGQEPAQFELFRDAEEAARYFSFIDIRDYDQTSFLRLLARNAVSTVIDIRPVPLFDRPKFRHGEVVDYMFKAEIVYFEYAVARLRDHLESNYKIARTVNMRRNAGLTLCVYDEASLNEGVVASVRGMFSRSNFYTIELTSRSLAN